MIPHLLRCQGFAVAYYGFTLGRLRSGASSTFAQLRFHKIYSFCLGLACSMLGWLFSKAYQFYIDYLIASYSYITQNGEKITQCEIKVIVLTCIFLHITGVKISWRDNYAGCLPINFYGVFGPILA